MSDEAARLEGIVAITGVPQSVKGLKDVGTAADGAQAGLDKTTKSAKKADEALDEVKASSKGAADGLKRTETQAKDTGETLATAGTKARRTKQDFEGLGRSSRGAGDELGGFGRRSRTTATDVDALRDRFDRAGTSMRTTGRSLTTTVTPALVGIAGLSFSKFATFDQTIRQVGSVADIAGRDLDGMRATALKLGKDTSFGANEAATAMLELAKGGISQAQMSAGVLDQTLTLAAAGSLELGSAAAYMTNTLNAFGLKAGAAGGVAAALAGGANASTASVESLGMGLAQTGRSAVDAGMSLNETVGALAAFENAGVKGSDAGTSLKTMLTRLVPQTKEAADEMKRLGLDFTDARGNMLPMRDVAQQLQTKLKGLSESQKIAALNTIFGSDASRAAGIMAENGAAGIDKMVAATKDLDAAQELAKVNMEGARGSIQQMTGSVETAAIKLGTMLAPNVVSLAEGVGHAADRFSALDANTQRTILTVGGIAAVSGPALMAFGSMADGAGKLVGAFDKVRGSQRLSALAMNPWTLGAAGLAIGAGLVYRAVKQSNAADEEWRQNGLQLVDVIARRKDAVTTLRGALGRARTAATEMADADDRFGRDSDQYKAAALKRRDALKEVADAKRDVTKAEQEAKDTVGVGDGKGTTTGSANAGEEGAIRASLVETENKITDALAKQKEARDKLLEQQATGTRTVLGETVAVDTYASRMAAAKTRMGELNEAMRTGNGDARQLAAEFREQQSVYDSNSSSLAKLRGEYKRAGGDVRDLRSEADKLAGSLGVMSKGAADQIVRDFGLVGMSAGEVKKKLSTMANTPLNMKIAQALLTEMTAAQRKAQFGTSNINAILKTIGNTPVSNNWGQQFAADLAAARAEAAGGVHVNITVSKHQNITTTTRSLEGGKDGNPATPFAKGGIISGPGTGTSDSILAMVSNGEAVVPEASTRANRGLVEWLIDNPGEKIQLPGFAKGKKPFHAADKNKDGKVTAGEKSAYAKAQAGSNLTAAKFDANTADPALVTKIANAQTQLEAAIIAQADALQGKPGAANDATSSKKRADALQAQYDAITGKDAAGRRKKLKPALDKAKAAAKAAQSRYDKLLATLSSSGDKRRSLASDIVGWEDQLASSSESATEKKAQEDHDAAALRAEALGEEDPDAKKRREAINAIRRAAGMSELARGDTLNEDGTITPGRGSTSDSPDLAAQLAQSQRRAQIAEDNLRIQTQAQSVFNGPGDIGSGGGALATAAGVNLHFHSTVPATAQQLASVADMALAGGAFNGYAAAAYNPVQQIGA